MTRGLRATGRERGCKGPGSDCPARSQLCRRLASGELPYFRGMSAVTACGGRGGISARGPEPGLAHVSPVLLSCLPSPPCPPGWGR